MARCRSALEHNLSRATPVSTIPPSNNNNNKPYFILHIGPSKTGTTTLQKDSVRLQRSLERDGFVYLGRYAPRSIRQPSRISEFFANDLCLQEVAASFQLSSSLSSSLSSLSSSYPRSTTLPPCWNERTRTIREYRANGTSIIVSDESLSYERQLVNVCNDPQYWPTLRTALVDIMDWNVRVVITYRRYAEWILSVAKEVNQKVCQNPSHPSAAQWNGGGGQRCWSLWHLIRTYLDTPAGDAFSYMNVDTTALAYSGAPLQILHLSSSSSSSSPTTNTTTTTTNIPLTTQFYCTVIPNSPHTCRTLQEETTPESLENTQSVMTTVYNDIVFDAAQRGWLNNDEDDDEEDSRTRRRPHNNTTRLHLTAELARRGTSMGLHMMDLPLICPPRMELERLLKKSLEMERIIVLMGEHPPPPPHHHHHDNSHHHHHEEENHHRQTFWRLADEDKAFCRVDTVRLFQHKTSWEQVVEHLQRMAGKRSFGNPS